MGNALYDEFQPGQTSLNGVPLPYNGWVEQMTGCAPSVAQALRPYPQYCDNLVGLNQNYGESQYNSLQMKLEKRFSQGMYALVSYTLSKTDIERVRQHAARRRAHGAERRASSRRSSASATRPIPWTTRRTCCRRRSSTSCRSATGKRYLNEGGVANALFGGWQVSTVYRYSSGAAVLLPVEALLQRARASSAPAASRPSSTRHRLGPGQGQLRSRCRSAVQQGRVRAGQRVQLLLRPRQPHRGETSAGSPTGTRTSRSSRTPGCLAARTCNSAFEMFNVWNWHMFSPNGQWGNQAFNIDIASPNFGTWAGGNVTLPRQMQLGIRFEF